MKRLSNNMAQTVYYAVSLIILKGASLLFLPVVTRYLAPSEFGTLDVILAFANISTIVVGFGMASALFRFAGLETDPAKQNRICAEILGLTLVIAIVCGFMLQGFVGQIIKVFPPEVEEVQLRLVIITLSMEGLIGLPLALMRFQSLAKTFFIVTVLKELTQLGLMFWALTTGLGVTGMLASGSLCSLLMATGLVCWQYKSTGICIRFSGFRRYAKYGLPIVTTGLAGFALVGLDRWVIATQVSIEQLAIYAIALKFSVVASFLLQPFGMWWFPRRFKVFKEQSKQRTAYFSAVGMAIAFLSVLLVSILAPIFIKVALPDSYHAGIQILPWLLLITLLKSASDYLNFGCFYQKSPTQQMFIQAACSIIALLGFYFTTPVFGLYGIIYTLIFAQTTRFILLYTASQRLVWLPYPKKKLGLLGGITCATLFGVNTLANSIAGMMALLIALFVAFIFAGSSGLLPMPRYRVRTL